PLARPPLPRPAAPAGAVPEREGRPADPGRRLPDPPPPRRGGGARPHPRPPPHPQAFLRHSPARGRRRPQIRSRNARPRRSLHDRALHARIRYEAPRVVLPGTSTCPPEDVVRREVTVDPH